MALLSLAVEYQIEDLQKLCEHHLAAYDCNYKEYQESRSVGGIIITSPPSSDTYFDGRFNYHQQVRMVKLAEDLNLEEFKSRMINKCAAKVSGEEVDRQWSLPENKGLSDKSYNQIIR